MGEGGCGAGWEWGAAILGDIRIGLIVIERSCTYTHALHAHTTNSRVHKINGEDF